MKKILVISHDAGGANILSSLTRKYKNNFNWTTCIFGPAKKIFPKGKSLTISPNLKENELVKVLKSLKPDLLLTGTSWGSSIEIDFIKAAKKTNIKTASFLDHWVNYKARFGNTKNWKKNLPHIVFVGDKWAYKIALRNGFSKTILRQVENPYFEEVIKQAEKIRKNKKNKENKDKIKILFLSQPIARYALKKHKDPFYLCNAEYWIIKNLLSIISIKNIGGLRLRIRLHPAEKVNKYSNLLESKKYEKIREFISLSSPASNSLVKDCLWADMVIGLESMALFIAKLIGKKIISYNPINKLISSLPDKKIRRIVLFEKLLEEIIAYGKHKKNQKTKSQKNRGNNLFAKELKKIINY